MAGESEIYLTEASANRIASAVRIVERMPRQGGFGTNPPRITSPFMHFKVTTRIGAATSQLAPGFGYGTMLDFDLETGLFTVATTASMENIKIFSDAEIAIIVGATVLCGLANGAWFYVVTQCTNGLAS